MKIRRDRLIFEEDLDRLRKLGITIDIKKKNESFGIYVADLGIKDELWNDIFSDEMKDTKQKVKRKRRKFKINKDFFKEKEITK